MIKGTIGVSQPSLPPLVEYVSLLQQIWDTKILTNNGPMHHQLEQSLCDYLNVQHLSLVSNGTFGLLLALHALELKGEVITTPFSYVATSNSLIWANCTPVFVDIDPLTLNIDPHCIEAAVTSRTVGVLPVNCYGQTCDMGSIRKIAIKHQLKVIYDAAHSFGVKDVEWRHANSQELIVMSFNAVKVFNTFEGGAIISPDAETKKRIDQLKNFGFDDERNVVEAGLNGKMCEASAALGLLQLKYIDIEIAKRQKVDAFYREGLHEVKGIRCLSSLSKQSANYGYFPILVLENFPLNRDALYEKLQAANIFARRYFYPLISDLSFYQRFPSSAETRLPVAHQAAEQVLCLPMYSELGFEDVRRVIDVIRRC